MKADKEDSQRHIIRHLGALTIPLRAAIKIVHSCWKAPREITSLKAYHVVVTPDSKAVITSEYLDLFKAQFASRCEEPERVAAALEDLKSAIVKRKANVHAEAALMSLASRDEEKPKVHVDGTLTPIANLLPVSAVRLVYCLKLTIHLSISV